MHCKTEYISGMFSGQGQRSAVRPRLCSRKEPLTLSRSPQAGRGRALQLLAMRRGADRYTAARCWVWFIE